MDTTRLLSRRIILTGSLLVLAQLLPGCAGVPFASREIPPLLGQPEVHIPDVDFLQVTPEMEEFLGDYVTSGAAANRRAWDLIWSTGHPNVLGFNYDPETTLTPGEAFRQRTGNCLSYSAMLIAMARHSRLDAWFQSVEVPPQWTQSSNTLLVSMHVNAVIRGDEDEWVVDVSRKRMDGYHRVRRISDAEALAQYYNNLGAEALTEERLAIAHAYFAKAIRTRPGLSYVWSNLGVVYNRNGQVEDARAAYITALEHDPELGIAVNNLYQMYQREGDLLAAQDLEKRVERHRRRNPYYLYYLSSLALAEGRYEESGELLRRAIRIDEREYRFHYGLARTFALAGEVEAAQASLERAKQLAPNEPLISQARIDNLPELP